MPTVRFTIGRQSYDLACEEGQQQRIHHLAACLNDRFMKLANNFQSAPDSLVLAITALMMEDEIETLTQTLQEQESVSHHNEDLEEIEKMIEDVVNPVANHIEMLAQKIERM